MTLRNLSADRPNITLDFRKSKKLDPRITFTRASYAPASDPSSGTGTSGGTIQEFNVNVPRLTDQGLLIEESRTNFFQDSRIANQSFWGADHVTSTTILAPDGSFAEKCAEKAQDSPHGFQQGIPGLASSTQTTFSIYAKAAGRNWVSIGFQDGSVGYSAYTSFDLSTGTIGTNKHTGTIINRPASASITPAGNGWYRLEVSRGTNGAQVFVFMTDSNPTGNGNIDLFTYTGGSNGDGIYLFGPQVEEQSYSGGFATSYIPTAGAQVTRAEDLCEITNDELSSWYNSSGGTYVTEFNSVGYGGTIPVYVNFIKGNTGRLEFNMDGVVYGLYNVQMKYGLNSPAFLNHVDNKIAMAHSWLTGEGGYSSNGITPIVTAAKNPAPGPYDPTRMAFGFTLYQNIGYGVSGYIQRFSYYPTRVSDDALQALTTQQDND